MELQKILKLDTAAVARIKCTFVRLYDADGGHCFSLNANDTGVLDMVIGKTATMPSDPDGRELVPITITSEVANILRSYLNAYCKNTHGLKEDAKRLAAHFLARPAGSVLRYGNLLNGTFYVKSLACNWNGANVEVGEVVKTDDAGNTYVEPVVKKKVSKKTKLALAGAALLALLNN